MTAKEYVAQFVSTVPLNTLRVLNIVYNGKKHPEVIQELKKQISSTVSLKLFVDNSLHDRVWIVNDNHAFIVGTSFGSIGKKVAFIVDLPNDDIQLSSVLANIMTQACSILSGSQIDEPIFYI